VPDTAGYLFIGVIAALVTFVSTPFVVKLATRMNWVVEPDERRVHKVPTPDVGGIAMFLGFIVALAIAWQMGRFSPVFNNNSEPLGVLLAAVVIFATGLVDDIREISSPAKVTGTVIAGLVLVYFGATMFYFRVPFLDVFVLSNDWIPLITILWLMGMSQAVNLIDGLDGLAAGIVAIAAASFFLYSRRLDDLGALAQPNMGPLIAIIALGVCLGFLPHNFNPAKIFMGDSGALFLGLCRRVWSGAAPTPIARPTPQVRPTFSWRRCLFRCSFWVCRFSTLCLPSFGGRSTVKVWQPPTRATCTTV
jgi:UDP-GlcNAc:undecaprenyl-phosphate GlcNAc-1-phosphate transferase